MKPKRARIFMMGDSLTEGDGSGSAYRYSLFERLYRAGAVFEFLGAPDSGDIRLPEAYARHGGHRGYVIGQGSDSPGSLRLKMTEPGYRAAAAQADMILLWIGTVDCDQRLDPDRIGERFNALLDDIYSVNPDVTVFAGTVLDYVPNCAEFNRFLLNYDVKGSLARGRRIRIVDMNQPEYRLNRDGADFLPGDRYPGECGNRKIAGMWLNAILNDVLEMNRQGDPDYAEPVRVSALSADLRDAVLRPGEGRTFRACAVPDNAQINTVLWKSSAPEIASVDDYGTVRAHRTGSALISAATLDGGFRALSRVNVTGEPFDPGEGLSPVLNERFDSAGNWEGDTKVIAPALSRLEWGPDSPSDGELRLKGRVPLGEKTLLSFDYVTANDKTHSRARCLSVYLGDVELRLCAGGMYAEIFEEGELKDGCQMPAKAAVRESYALMREGRALTLYKNNEKLLSCKASCVPAEGDLRLEWHEFNHRNSLWELTVKRG